jgi:CubicO group peptidase (beta-lactamase class C family)
MRTLVLALLTVAIAPGTGSAQRAKAADARPGPAALSPGFDQFAEGLLAEWKIPGMAVGVIKDGKVVLLKGYGFRNLEDKQPVTPATLMAIGSNSKSFTVVLMSELVDEGKLDWDKPVKSYLPDFQLADDYATKNMRVKDLVTHVSGLPRHDGLWYGRTTTRKDIYQHLRFVQPSTTFRGYWQYNNLMFVTAGYLVEQLTGKSWDALIREKIFGPLGMSRSNTSTNDMPGSGDFAYPYELADGKLTRVPFRNLDNAAPAGSINSSVEEMLHYVQMHINKGEWNGHRILSEKNDLKMQSPQSVVGESMEYPELGPETYGLATWVSSYRGHKWVQHGGGIDGFISQMAWLPNDNIGAVVLTNMSGEANPVPTTVVKRVFDDLLGLPPIDWNARDRVEVAKGKAQADSAKRKLDADRVAEAPPSHVLDAYAGRYGDDGYGVIEVVTAGKGLTLKFDGLDVPLEHYHYDVFRIAPLAGRAVPLTGLVQFKMGPDGKVNRVAIPLEPAIAPIELKRQ